MINVVSLAKFRPGARLINCARGALVDEAAVAAALAGQGITVERFCKPTHTKPAPEAIIEAIVERCDVVVEGLAD